MTSALCYNTFFLMAMLAVTERSLGAAAARYEAPKRWVNLHNDLLAGIHDYGIDLSGANTIPLGGELRPTLHGFGRSSILQSTPQAEQQAGVGIVFRNIFPYETRLTNPYTGAHMPDHYPPTSVD